MSPHPTIKSEARKKVAYNEFQIKQNATEIAAIEPQLNNPENLAQNLANPVEDKGYEVNRKEHIPILILLTIGMMLQLAGNTFAVAAGVLICVSVCVLVCFTVLISAIFPNSDSKSAVA
jgi:hypothetical protein